MSKYLLIYNTVKHMTVRQWYYRAYYMLRKRIHKKPYTGNIDFSKLHRIRLDYEAFDDACIKKADDICRNEFCLVSDIRTVLTDNDWNLTGNTYRLVCFRLNSFEWLWDLSDAYQLTGNVDYIKKGFELCDSWLAYSKKSFGKDPWNAYVLAGRITNWIYFLSEYGSDEQIEHFAKSLISQTLELRYSVEYQLGANHLLSEAKALVVAGYFLSKRKIYEYGKKLLKKEHKEQFLGDGGHYERSVSYHVESLQQYFEAVYVMRYCKDKEYIEFSRMLADNYIFLNDMIEADGHIPLLNDAAYDYPFDAADFLGTSEYLYDTVAPRAKDGRYSKRWKFDNKKKCIIKWPESKLNMYSDTGIVVDTFSTGTGENDIVFDVGNNGPDYNLGHTHADALSITLTTADKRVLVDSGVFTYEKGEKRDYCRSTKAHNTVEIDGTSSAEVWSAFRVARRGHVTMESVISDSEIAVTAVSDGYAKILKDNVIHKRCYKRNRLNNSIVIDDVITGNTRHSACMRFYIGPEVKISQVDEYTIMLDDIAFKCTEKLRLEECQIARAFGICEETYRIVSEYEVDKEKCVTTTIIFQENEI